MSDFQKRTGWRGPDITFFLLLAGLCGGCVGVGLFGFATGLAFMALLQLAECVLHAVADAFEKKP